MTTPQEGDMTVAAALRDAPHASFREAGYWLDKTVDQLLAEAAARAPDKVAMIADRADRKQASCLTYAELVKLADRAASSLLRLGVGRGDVVTVQLPNWWEFVVTAFACSKIGAVMNPVMPILRERELVYILNFCQAKVFIVPKTYRGFDYAAMAQGMRVDLPNLKHVIVVDGEGEGSFERTLLASEAGQLPSGLGPDDMAVLMFTSGTTGEPIPSVLIERAANELGLKVCSLWGMTEVLSGTLTEPSRAAEKSASTDGRPQDGMEVRIVDLEGRPVAAGQSGRLLVRGAQMFKGYYKRPELQTFDSEGWFDSGDLAYTDDDGYIRISGRVKDILIRGGENVPIVEIENLLYKHPAVAAVAVVGFPDARLGERGCAFIVPRPGSSIDLATVQAYLREAKMAKQFWPERVEGVGELPRTASGRLQKFKLKEVAAAFAEAK